MDPLRSDLLSDSPARRLRRLADQACDELEDRLRRGEPCRSEDLLASYPELAEHEDYALELIGLEFSLRRQLGQAPSLDDYRSRFPQWREALKLLLATLSVPATCGSADQRTLPELPRGTEVGRTRDFRRLLGRYELLERIGHGGMGDVYRARQCPPLERTVALKLLRTGDEFEVLTFEKEIEVARRLRHPNLLPIYDAGCIDGEYYYTMPLLGGGSLLKRLSRGQPEPRWAAALVEKVARAVHYAHQRGVLHRDLKPANILLDDDEEPLVADFGLAKLLDRSLAQTQTGQLLGSVPYMSPEQARGEGHRATPASDVWSLGVILYEMLTGQRPFQGDSHSEIMRRILRIEPFPLRQLQGDLPPDLETICLKCLEKDAAWRYGSAEELADDLKRWLDGVPLPQPGQPSLDRLRRLAQRSLRWPRVSAGTMAVLGGIALLLLCLVLLPSDSPRPSETAKTAQTRTTSPEELAKPGSPVLLFSPRRPLRESSVVVGANAAKIVMQPSGMLSLDSLSFCLLEILPPNPRRGGYRLTVVMRQTDLADLGEAGLYFSRRGEKSRNGVEHSFGEASFVEAGLAIVREPPSKTGILMLRVKHLLVPPEGSPRPFTVPPCAQRELAKRAGEGSPWRTFLLEVGDAGVRMLERDQRDCRVLRAEWREKWRMLHRLHPFLDSVPDGVSPQGGCGFYLVRGAIEIREVRFEPLDDPR